VYGLLATDAALATAAGYADTTHLSAAIFGSNSVDDVPAPRPFIVLHWGSVEPTRYGTVGRRELTIWVYDEPADYARIDAMLRRIRTLISSAVGVATTLGWLHQVDWLGESDDLWDESYQAIARNVVLRCVGTI
jgi:hypothetical protein